MTMPRDGKIKTNCTDCYQGYPKKDVRSLTVLACLKYTQRVQYKPCTSIQIDHGAYVNNEFHFLAG